MTRVIEDRRTGREGHLSGRADFTPDAAGLAYEEQGILSFAGQPDVHARQGYHWAGQGALIVVTFADGRAFHRIELNRTVYETRHDCPPDTYDVAYDFSAWPAWSTVWNVAGPRKGYTMTTRYRRAAPG